jgi:hypothetical protein
MNTAHWMRNLNDNKLLRQIVMPGSHDAGVYGTSQTILRSTALGVKKQYVVCQHSDFGLQAMSGSRFFDCRVFFRKIPRDERQAPDQKYENLLGHFGIERVKLGKLKLSQEPALGGYGGSLSAILSQAFDFVIGNTSEFVILRFSHTYHPTECIQEIKRILDSKPVYKNHAYKNNGNIAMKRVGELRGKVIMVFDEKFNQHITPGEGILRFSKFSVGKANIDGLSTCGEFARDKELAKVYAGAMRGVREHLDNHPGDGAGHLHFVYWQQTASAVGEKDVFKTTVAPKVPGQQWSGGAQSNLGDLIAQFAAQRDQAHGRMPVNVVSHDFVTSETCEKVIRLNPNYPP